MIDDDGRRSRTETMHVESWEKFQAYVESLENDPSRKVWDEVWFRGQGDAEWKLHTTLERRAPWVAAVSSYPNPISEN